MGLAGEPEVAGGSPNTEAPTPSLLAGAFRAAGSEDPTRIVRAIVVYVCVSV